MNEATTSTSRVQLGQRYRDRVTEFEGIATVRTETLFGETRILLEGPGDKKQMIGDGYFLEQRLVPVEGETIDISEVSGSRALSGTATH